MEAQNIEFKQAWKDDCIKCLSAFANGDGGVLYVGLDDDGKAVGVKDAKKLLVDIPNKLQSLLGIVASVELKKDKGREIIKISIEPYPYPVSYKGAYYRRSASSCKSLKAARLMRFTCKNRQKMGRNGCAILEFQGLG